MTSCMAVPSPALAISIALRVMASASPSSKTSIASVVLFRVPLGLPEGLPLLPGLKKPIARSNRLGFRRRSRYLRRMSPRLRSRPLADIIEPCLPRPADRPPAGGDWIHEIKHDGFRIMARRDGAGVRLLTRNGHDFAGRFPLAAAAVAALPVRSCLIDGEAIVTDQNGLAVFDLIRGHRPTAAVLCAFDLLDLDGEDLRREPIETRKSTLKSLLRGKRAGIAFNAHFIADGAIVYRQACALGCEGIVSKRLGSPYRSGRADCWVKVKNPTAPAVTREAEEEWN